MDVSPMARRNDEQEYIGIQRAYATQHGANESRCRDAAGSAPHLCSHFQSSSVKSRWAASYRRERECRGGRSLRRVDAVTLFNPYQVRAESPQLYRSLEQQDQSGRLKHSRKKGNNVSRLSKCDRG
jgi:hypothetical protein